MWLSSYRLMIWHSKWYNLGFSKILTNCSHHILTFSLRFLMICLLEYIKFIFILSYRFCFSIMTMNLLIYLEYWISKQILIIDKYWWLIDYNVMIEHSIDLIAQAVFLARAGIKRMLNYTRSQSGAILFSSISKHLHTV